MYGEAARVYAELHGVVDERERHHSEQDGKREQHNAYLGDVGIDLIHKVALVFHLSHIGIALQLARNVHERIVVRIISL